VIVDTLGGELDKYLHFRDTNHKNPKALTTLHIVGREYFERDHFIYHPNYVSVWADNWNDDIAKARGCYKYSEIVIFKHLHCAYHSNVVRDAQYAKTEDRKVYAKDRATYKRMKREINKYV
jgi:hypothetical protein